MKLSVVDVRRAGRHIAIASVTGKDILTATTVDTPPVPFTLGNQGLPTLGEFSDLIPGGDRKACVVLEVKHLLVVQRCLYKLINTVKFDTLAELARTIHDILGSHALTVTVSDGILKISIERPISNQPRNQFAATTWDTTSVQLTYLISTERALPYAHIIDQPCHPVSRGSAQDAAYGGGVYIVPTRLRFGRNLQII